MLFATVLAVGAMLWVYALGISGEGPFLSQVPYLGLDVLLAIPVAGVAILAAGALRRRLGLGDGTLVRAGTVAAGFTVLLAPLAAVQGFGHAVAGAAGLNGTDPASLAGYGVTTALQAWPGVLLAALVGAFGQRLLAERTFRRRTLRWLLGTRRPLTVVASVGGLVAGLAAVAVLPASPAVAQPSGCGNAPTRTFDVSAIDITMTVNRHGDNDPYAYMYALDQDVTEIRDFEEALLAANDTEDDLDPVTGEVTPWPELVANDPGATLVSSGLDQDPIQPLVLRARLGECVVINLTNEITRAPVTGQANRLMQYPGGPPSVSIDMQGVSYDAAGGDGGQDLGLGGPARMAEPGGDPVQYQFFLDPLMGEGTRVFRSGGDSTQLTAHGLFGALIAEPARATWADPDTGVDMTGDGSAGEAWSNWEAIITAPDEEVPVFREFVILYHEVGDETFTLRRPTREDFGGAAAPRDDPFDTSGDPREIGGSLPMIDRRAPDAGDAFRRGGGSHSYRPGGKGINYRAESFFRRLQHENAVVDLNDGTPDDSARAQIDNKSLGYSSYTYGDPATPVAESYLGEPTKTRLAHAGFETLHVHHLHGGGDRWRQNPDADDTAMDSGLDKDPIQDATSIRLDSQTLSPQESFNLEHECGAGGCQQAAGDFLFHCHIAHHYISGMWGIWRVFDTAQRDADGELTLAFLPNDDPTPDPVTSAELIGRQMPDGRTIVAPGDADQPNEVDIDDWIRPQLPPRGVRIDRQDATVWDWQRDTTQDGAPDAPIYKGEPDYGDTTLPAPGRELRAWENFRSADPGERPNIGFNPDNGRPAFPMLRPHLAYRPPFSADEHSGAPWLGETGDANRPDGLCPAGETVRTYNITAVTTEIQMTARERDPAGMLFMLNDEFTLNADGVAEPVPGKNKEPLVIRSNVSDCVAITLANQLDIELTVEEGFHELAKTNMHTHFVQFDPQASDGVIVGFNFEQSMHSTQRTLPGESAPRELVDPAAPDDTTLSVNQVDRLHADTDPGVAIAIGVGTPEIEIRTVLDADPGTNTITLDRALNNNHPAGASVSVEFVQYRWFSDVDSGTVFWHDHVDGIISWAHGLFGAHIIEPEGSTYHDPETGTEVDSGAIVDIRNDLPGASAGVGQSGDFREFMVFLHNGRPGSPITHDNNNPTRDNRFGQECEEATINLQAEPLGDRTPPGEVVTAPGDPLEQLDVLPVAPDGTTTDQRFEFNGFQECRNSYDRTGPNGHPAGRLRPPDVPDPREDSVEATVTTVDPYAFSSVVYGDPRTPLFRAYAGDDVVVRTIGTNERAEGLRFQGHRFRMERFNPDGQLMDTAITGISERFDYVLDGGAGGPAGGAGDFLYYSSRTFALESGGWGIFRVHDTLQPGGDPDSPELKPLPDNPVASGDGFPVLEANDAANPQANPGAPPEQASSANVSDGSSPCPRGQIPRIYSITAFDHPLPTSPFSDTEGVVYALTADYPDILSGAKEVEPLVLRVNQGECVLIRVRNRINNDLSPDGTGPGSRYGGERAGLDLGMLARNQQLNGGPIGLNPDNTALTDQNTIYEFFADQEVGTTIFQNLGSPASLRHGAYGLLIVEPAGSEWFDSHTGEELGSTATSTEAVIVPPNGEAFREFAMTVHSTDQQFSRSVVPYMDVIAGSGINSLRSQGDGGQPETRVAPIAGAPPGTRDTNGSFNKGFNHVSYRSEPLTDRVGLTNDPGHVPNTGNLGWFICDPNVAPPSDAGAACNPGFVVDSPFHNALSSLEHGDPDTPIFEAEVGDPTVFRVGIPTSDQLHSVKFSGHMFPLEPNMWNGTNDRRSHLMTARTLTGGMVLNAEMVGGAGGPSGNPGDYAYQDARQPFTQAGMWGIFRVQPNTSGIIPVP